MKKNLSGGLATLAVLGCGLFFSTERASASVTGSLQLDGGAATVSAFSLVWKGDATVNGVTTLTYGSDILVPGGTDVMLANLPGSLPIPINDFMTFVGIPSLDFILDLAGPGSTNTNCSAAGLTASGNGECSAFAGSPLILSQAANGTLVALGVSGTVSDGTTPISIWNGEFDETVTSLGTAGTAGYINDPTPLQIQQYFGGPDDPNSNTLTQTYSGTFTATIESIVPEPSPMLMMLLGGGLILIAVSGRRKHPRL